MRKLNEGYFQPRGLYCLTMSLDCAHEGVVFEETVARCISEDIQAKGFKRKIGIVKGVTGPLGFPESASLVSQVPKWFEDEKMGGWERFWKFAGDYYDRRGQAIYVSSAYLPEDFYVETAVLLTSRFEGFQQSR